MIKRDFTRELIEAALKEDLWGGDITTEAVVNPRETSTAVIEAKQDLILAGVQIAGRVFRKVDKYIEFEPKVKDGERVRRGELIASIKGKTCSILAAERTALNFLQHLSGIATETRRFVEKIKGTKAKILDTRKTTPGWRALEKYAVRMGGGHNHRMGLYDRYLIKNNHIIAAGTVNSAVERVIKRKKKGLLVEVEVKDLSELESILDSGVDVVMLDNFIVDDVKKAVSIVKGRFKIEVSGNITLENVKSYAVTGVDYISVGRITHSAPAADLHMKFIKN